MFSRLAELLQRAERSESVLAVILTGAGGYFTSGADIKELQNDGGSRRRSPASAGVNRGFNRFGVTGYSGENVRQDHPIRTDLWRRQDLSSGALPPDWNAPAERDRVRLGVQQRIPLVGAPVFLPYAEDEFADAKLAVVCFRFCIHPRWFYAVPHGAGEC